MDTATARQHDTPIERFRASLPGPNLVERLRNGLIGDDARIDGPFGPKRLVYADYVASGRAMAQVEDFVMREVLPYYGNTHTQASFCGAYMTRLRGEARAAIARLVGAGESCEVIFAGCGATSGLNRLVHLLGVNAALARGERPVVLIGPYEHHSNILPWRESGAEVVEIPEAADGGPDLAALARELDRTEGRRLRIGAFSAASNVTGILVDVDRVTALLAAHGALSVWDYAGGGPYLPIDMNPVEGAPKDAVVVSPHKFPGGPGASGVLIVRRSAVVTDRPTWPGGGAVTFVSPWAHDYAAGLATREEAGTPNVIGDIRAALAFLIKEAVGHDDIAHRDGEMLRRALCVWRQNPNLELLGHQKAARLPIFSFRVRAAGGGYVHHQLFTRMLSDAFGVQARGGLACAGPYAHRLLGIDEARSTAIRDQIRSDVEIDKPGWVRLNFSYLMSDEKVDTIIRAVDQLARDPDAVAGRYVADVRTARFLPAEADA